jgi:hypothetical protein
MMAKRPTERFESVATAIEALRQAVRSPAPPAPTPGAFVPPAAACQPAPIPAPHVTTAGSGGPWVASQRTTPLGPSTGQQRQALLVCLAAVSLVILVGLAILVNRRSPAAPSPVVSAPALAESVAGGDPLVPYRQRLHTAATCEELQSAHAALESASGGQDVDALRLRAGDCSMLRRRHLCRQCFRQNDDDRHEYDEYQRRGHGQDEE